MNRNSKQIVMDVFQIGELNTFTHTFLSTYVWCRSWCETRQVFAEKVKVYLLYQWHNPPKGP